MSQRTMIRIQCGQCDHSFVINTNDDSTEIICPYCQTHMAENMVARVKEAWGYASDLNIDFEKYHGESNEPIFRVNLESEEVHFPFDDNE